MVYVFESVNSDVKHTVPKSVSQDYPGNFHCSFYQLVIYLISINCILLLSNLYLFLTRFQFKNITKTLILHLLTDLTDL